MKTTASHSTNFDHPIRILAKDAYENEFERHKEYGQSKTEWRNYQQNGDASAACLLIFLQFEYAIRSALHVKESQAIKNLAYSSTSLVTLYATLALGGKNGLIREGYVEELITLRDCIVHAYRYEGEIVEDDYQFVAFSEKATAGRNKDKTTPTLGFSPGPNTIYLKDIAVAYVVVCYLLKSAGLSGLDANVGSWKSASGHCNPIEWFKRAMKDCGLSNNSEWCSILEAYENL